MKAILIGCGSIGRRHLINLVALKKIDKVFVYTKVKNCLKGLETRGKVEVVDSISNLQADFGIIANETYKHIDSALLLAEKGIHLFIEKPLTHKLSKKIALLKKIVNRNKLRLAVGYNLRFLRAIELIKGVLSRKALGKIYFVKIEAGQYLPSWRKGRDYRFSYSAFRNKGGGVALDLSHEIDYMRYLFGDPLSFKSTKAKVSNLDIDSEDIFEGIYKYNGFICTVHLDYLQKRRKRFIRIEGSKGYLFCDLAAKRIKLEINGGKKVITDSAFFNLSDTYRKELADFIVLVEKAREPRVGFSDGLRVLELIGAVHV